MRFFATPQLLLSLIVLLHSVVIAQVPANVMLPLDTVVKMANGDLALKDEAYLRSSMQRLKDSGTQGIMSDCWWGLVEDKGPRQYNFQPYIEMATIANDTGLQIQMVMSFHQCGGNVGDDCNIPIPHHWFTKNDVWYTTRSNKTTDEYISLWADNVPLDKFQRTPLQMYKEFMAAFKKQVVDVFPHVVTEVQIGGGPAGELRYPSYQLQDGRWNYCGVGEFTSYDRYAAQAMKDHAVAKNKTKWGISPGPANAGDFNCKPGVSGDCPFYSGGLDNYASDYGRFFLTWYSNSLIQHGRSLSLAGRQVFGPSFTLSIKVSGVHWWYDSPHHGAELTAGYMNTNGNNGYQTIVSMLKENDIRLCFTCMEMSDNFDGCRSKPSQLVEQVRQAIDREHLELRDFFAGENALDFGADQMGNVGRHMRGAAAFTFLRLGPKFDFNFFATHVVPVLNKA